VRWRVLLLAFVFVLLALLVYARHEGFELRQLFGGKDGADARSTLLAQLLALCVGGSVGGTDFRSGVVYYSAELLLLLGSEL
jgi:hypothetical protein